MVDIDNGVRITNDKKEQHKVGIVDVELAACIVDSKVDKEELDIESALAPMKLI